MASGTLNVGVNDYKDAYGLWYKAGDRFTVGIGKGTFAGYYTSTTVARCTLPLSKPVKPGVSASVYGTFRIRAEGSSKDVVIASSSPLSCSITDCGLMIDVTDGTTLWSAKDVVCSVGIAGSGITVTFS